uniref:Glycosyltransferase N-terminal domain-containing protein n=2 Tax=Aegilops tauschii subsp. strangulata TaxID=200361 RepID=A0A453MIM9_AEGTS
QPHHRRWILWPSWRCRSRCRATSTRCYTCRCSSRPAAWTCTTPRPRSTSGRRARVHGWAEDALQSIHFHDLGISSYVSPPPDPTADSPFPSHLMPLFNVYIAGARAPLSGSCRRRVVVVHDRINAFASEEAARLPNAEAFGLHCLALSMLVGRMDAGHRLLRETGLAFRAVEHCATKEFVEFAGRARPSKQISPGAGILANTCRALEGDFIDVVAGHLAADGKKLFAVGPLNPLLHHASAPEQSERRHECLNWLDEQPPASVLYVSFGTTSSLRAEQIEELAAALRGSRQRFIWVLRDADRGDIFAEAGGESRGRHGKMLSEFTRHTQGTGLVITGWAPQLEILAHSAMAAFMSHCGWNSTVESLSHGRPILACPCTATSRGTRSLSATTSRPASSCVHGRSTAR